MSISIPEPISMGVMLTYKCTASCCHCIYACSPEWTADWIKEEERLLFPVSPVPGAAEISSAAGIF